MKKFEDSYEFQIYGLSKKPYVVRFSGNKDEEVSELQKKAFNMFKVSYHYPVDIAFDTINNDIVRRYEEKGKEICGFCIYDYVFPEYFLIGDCKSEDNRVVYLVCSSDYLDCKYLYIEFVNEKFIRVFEDA